MRFCTRCGSPSTDLDCFCGGKTIDGTINYRPLTLHSQTHRHQGGCHVPVHYLGRGLAIPAP